MPNKSQQERYPEEHSRVAAGITARRDGVHQADATIGPAIDWTAPRFHRELFDPHTNMGRRLVQAIADLIQGQDDPYRALEESGVLALDETYADLCIGAVSGIKNDLWELLRVTRQLGTGQTSLDLRSPREDLDRATIPIFGASDVTPEIAIHLDGRFNDRKAEQRRDVLDLCLALAEGCRVYLVVTGQAGRMLWEHHRDQLPLSVTEPFDPRATPSPGTPRSVTDRVETARETLDPDGTATAVLRELRAEHAEMLSYDDLSRELGLSEENRRQIALKLDRQFKLAERIDYPGGGRGLSLRPAGNAYLDAVNSEIGRQQRLSTTDPDSVTALPNLSDNSRVTPHVHEGQGQQGDDEADYLTTDRLTNEGETVAATESRPHGHVRPVYLDRPSFEGARMAAYSGEIALVDAPTEELSRRDGKADFRVMGWSYDEADEDLVVAATYTNPMQYWTCIARALASHWTWERILTADVLGEIFGAHSPRILRDARNIGGLSDERYENPDAFIEHYREQERTLCDLTRRWFYGEYDDAAGMRSEITTLAKGLSGSIAQLLDLAGVTLVREVRLPEFSRNWSDAERRQTLVRTLAHGCSIESLYGHFVVHRQLYEQRECRRAAAMDPDVDASDPFAELIGSIVVVGPGVPALENELRSALRSPGELHEDAPEIAVRLPIRTSTSRSIVAQTVRRLCKRKRLEATRKAISLFDAFLTTSYDIARAIHRGLEAEENPRELHVDEVRRSLAHVDPDRLLVTTEVNRSMQKALSVLFGAARPLSGAEIARRAGITTESFRQNREGFVGADLLREVLEGWRLSLSFADERYGRDVLPWFFVEDPKEYPYISSVDLRQPSDVLYELAVSLVDDPSRFGDPEDVLYQAFAGLPGDRSSAFAAHVEEWPWLRSIRPIIDAACSPPRESAAARTTRLIDSECILMGPPLSQQPLVASNSGAIG